MGLVMGVHLGQGFEPSALCVAEANYRGREDFHFVVRFLQRLEPASSYPLIASRLGEVVSRLPPTGLQTIRVNVTGHGPPAVDLLAARTRGVTIEPVYFNHGDRYVRESDGLRLGKVCLVTRLKALLQCERLHLAARPEARELASDLREYRPEVRDDASSREGAFRVGRHDDLVTALGLAVLDDPHEWGLVHTAQIGEDEAWQT